MSQPICPKCGNSDPEKLVPHIKTYEFTRKTPQRDPMRVASWTCRCGETFSDRPALAESAREKKLDLVNEYFHQFYPADHDTAWVMEYCVQGHERRYNGKGGHGKTIFPYMVCADGFEMSVQGHFGAYSRPRGDFEDCYSAVEIMTDTPRAEPLLEEFSRTDPEATYSIYGFVPIDLVLRVIEKHGGLKPRSAT